MKTITIAQPIDLAELERLFLEHNPRCLPIVMHPAAYALVEREVLRLYGSNPYVIGKPRQCAQLFGFDILIYPSQPLIAIWIGNAVEIVIRDEEKRKEAQPSLADFALHYTAPPKPKKKNNMPFCDVCGKQFEYTDSIVGRGVGVMRTYRHPDCVPPKQNLCDVCGKPVSAMHMKWNLFLSCKISRHDACYLQGGVFEPTKPTLFGKENGAEFVMSDAERFMDVVTNAKDKRLTYKELIGA